MNRQTALISRRVLLAGLAICWFGSVPDIQAADEKPFSKAEWQAIPLSKKADWSREQLARSFCQAHQTSNIQRQQIVQWLGEPTISSVISPGTANTSTLDQYALKAGTNSILRFDYDEKGLTRSSPMLDGGTTHWDHFPGPGKVLKEDVLKKFLTPAAIHTSYDDCVKLLGKPDTTWRDSAQVGGRYWNWQMCQWRLSPDGRKFLVTQWEVTGPALGKESLRLYTYSTTQLGPDCPTKLDTN